MKRSARAVGLLAVIALSFGCARAKISNVRHGLESNAFAKADTIAVKDFSVDKMTFTGDKSDDGMRVTQEKHLLRARLAQELVNQLVNKGFNAKKYEGAKDDADVVIEGVVNHFDHGSAAKRMFLGAGSGSSNLFMSVRMTKGKKDNVISDFDVIATSGGNGGLGSLGSFIDAHITDGSEKIAEFVAEKIKQ